MVGSFRAEKEMRKVKNHFRVNFARERKKLNEKSVRVYSTKVILISKKPQGRDNVL